MPSKKTTMVLGRRFNNLSVSTLLVALVLTACSTNESTSNAGSGLCQSSGKATAYLLQEEKIHFEGEHAIGGAGDFLLQNDHAAFIIEGVDRGTSYYHYGGIVVDAVAMDGCTQKTEDNFQEMGLMLGSLNLGAFYDSTLRAFRATSIEVLEDGSDGGPAVVRARGVDDYYWLVEYTLIAAAADEKSPKELSTELGLEVVVDYTLHPDSPVLQIDFNLVNQQEEKQELMSAVTLIFGNQTQAHRFANDGLDLSGFSFSIGIPWLTAAMPNGQGAYSFAFDDAHMGNARLAGVEAMFDLNQITNDPIKLRDKGDSDGVRYYLSAGSTDGHSASAPLKRFLPNPLIEFETILSEFNGSVIDTAGRGIENVEVVLQANTNGVWEDLDSYATDVSGNFGPTVAHFDTQPLHYRFVAKIDNRNDVVAPLHDPSRTKFEIVMEAAGRLDYDIRSSAGSALPAKVVVYPEGSSEEFRRWYLHGSGSKPLPPGSYDIYVSRGFEYSLSKQTIEVPAGGAASLVAVLKQIVDTSGYMSIDTHVHSAPSPDSNISVEKRIRSMAAEGLEIPVATDHEIITGIEDGVDATGLWEFVKTITGEEVTAILPEHMTMFPVVPDGSLRGGPVRWYQLGFPELFEAMYNRGAEIVMINHPRQIFRLFEWDPITSEPKIKRYSDLQMTKSSKPWSWNFDGIEVMNGYGNIFKQKDDNGHERLFDNWMGFHNHGHRIVGTAASDVHSLEDTGMPRSFFIAPTDKPREFEQKMAVDAYKNGQVLMSTGAFARISINEGYTLGQTVKDTDGQIDINIHVEAIPEIDVAEIHVYANCDEVHVTDTTDPDALIKFSASVTADLVSDAHIVVAGFGKKKLPLGFVQFDPTGLPRFLSNPIYVDVDGNGNFDPPGDKDCTYTVPAAD